MTFKFKENFTQVFTSAHVRQEFFRPFPGVRLQHRWKSDKSNNYFQPQTNQAINFTVYHRIVQKQSHGSLSCVDRAECRYHRPLRISQILVANLPASFGTLDCQPETDQNVKVRTETGIA